MGDYATTTSIPALLPNYLRGNSTAVDPAGTAVFSGHITRAESVVNAYIGRRYSLPFIVGTTTTNVPPILRTISEDLACFYAMRSSFNEDGKIKNPYLDSYQGAMSILEGIGLGTIPLTYTDGSEVPSAAASLAKATTRQYTPVFGLDNATSWRRDPDEVRDTRANRSEI